jgi:hypothetical protein
VYNARTVGFWRQKVLKKFNVNNPTSGVFTTGPLSCVGAAAYKSGFITSPSNLFSPDFVLRSPTKEALDKIKEKTRFSFEMKKKNSKTDLLARCERSTQKNTRTFHT